MLLCAAMMMSAALASNAVDQGVPTARLEMIDWLNPERALKIVEAAPPLPVDANRSTIESLEIQATVFANNNRFKDVEDVLARLDALARAGSPEATRAAHYVRAYMASLRGRFAESEAEFKLIDLRSVGTEVERYRMLMFQGYLLRTLGKDEEALPALEKGLDLATRMGDDHRILYVLLALARLHMDSGNFERASAETQTALRLATRLKEEGALADIWLLSANLSDRRGDSAADLRNSLLALEHAKRSGSSKWLSMTLVSLSSSYLKSGNFAEALRFAKAGLPIVIRRNDQVDIQYTRFVEGLAYIGLGRIKEGQFLAEDSIAKTLAGGNLLDARDLLLEYEQALEKAGFLAMALDVYHRYTETNQKFMSPERQSAFLELSARFDNERKASELAILRRDSAIKASELAKVRAESSAASANASRATLIRNVAIYVGASLLLGIVAIAWALRRRRDAAQARKASMERIAALGRLTGGIAHEFNNQLTVAQQALGLLAQKPYLATDPEGKALIEELQDSSRALAYTTAQLQSFSRQQNLRPQLIVLSGFLLSKRTILERTAGSSVTVQMNTTDETLSAWVDERQLLAALMNLVANARDAMSGSGHLIIDVAALVDTFVCVTVIDTGVGMDAETLSRATEPFFTTKALGAGTGLGLSMVDGFARQSGGRIGLSSELGHGTRIAMILPRQSQPLPEV